MQRGLLELVILTAARTGEVINARWDEIDLAAKVWTIPAERMKAKASTEFTFRRGVSVLKTMKDRSRRLRVCGASPSTFVIDGPLALLERMGRSDLTVHGFRSTFRDWAAETTNYPREVAEAALAHVISDKTEAAYRRGDLFEKRRKLLQTWADYCSRRLTSKVTSISSAARRSAKQ
jgi:integrase